MWAALAAALLLGPGLAPASLEASAPKPPHVTLIGDSVADPLLRETQARTILSRGVDLELEIEACRHVAQESCSIAGVRPPTLLDLVAAKGPALAPTVIVAVGYNDFAEAYGRNIEAALAALHDVGVTHVLWTTLRASRQPYPGMNEEILAAARRHPDLVVVDWDAYARDHPEWFQDDAVHLAGAGAEAMAELFHGALVGLGIPLTVTAVSPAHGRPGGGTRVRITGTGFTPGSTVAFGAAAATHVVVESQEAIRATVPPGRGTVDVTVTSANGTSAPSPAATYSYRATCTVPRVVGMRIRAASRAIASAGCALGSVRRRPSTWARQGVVTAQRPAAGAERPMRAAVDIVVGAGRTRP